MEEVWAELRGEGNVTGIVGLGEVVPVREGDQVTCQHLELKATMVNVFACSFSMRYVGAAQWQVTRVPDHSAPSIQALTELCTRLNDRLVVSFVADSETQVEINVTNYSHNNDVIEYKFSPNMAAILGVDSERIYIGTVRGESNVDALVDRAVLLSPLVRPNVSVAGSQLGSLGVWSLDGEKSCQRLGRLNLGHVTAPRVLGEVPIGLASFANPTLYLQATSFRLLVCLVIHRRSPVHQ